MFDWAKQTWSDLPSMPHPRAGLMVATWNDQLYVSGGKYKRSWLSSVLCYSFETKQWRNVTGMNEGRAFGHLIEYKDHLYAIGGGTNTVERYDPVKDEWTMMTSMAKSQAGFGATLHEDKIYVCGDEGFEMYDPDLDVWTALPGSLPRHGLSLVSINSKLLALGSEPDKLNSFNIEKYGFDMVNEFNLQTIKLVGFCKMDPQLDYHCAVVGDFV